jgi:hypothetical protein
MVPAHCSITKLTLQPNSLLECYCGNGLTVPVVPVTCPAHGLTVLDGAYWYDDHHGSHGFSRRRALEQALMKQKAAALCPAGMKACHIDGADHFAFEVRLLRVALAVHSAHALMVPHR